MEKRIGELKKEHPKLILLNAGGRDSHLDTVNLKEMFQREVFEDWNVVTAKKGEKNAVPALVVHGPGMGRLKWVQSASTMASPAVKRKLAKAAGTVEATKKTLAEKRESYDKRRRQIVIDAVKKKLETLACVADRAEAEKIEGGEVLLASALVVKAIGITSVMFTPHGLAKTPREMTFPSQLTLEHLRGLRLKNDALGSGKMKRAVLDACWRLLRVFLGEMQSGLSVSPASCNNDSQYGEAEIICNFLRFDLPALRADAAREIPYAKTWRGEVEDEWIGTGKSKTPSARGEDHAEREAEAETGEAAREAADSLPVSPKRERKSAKRKRRGSIKKHK